MIAVNDKTFFILLLIRLYQMYKSMDYEKTVTKLSNIAE